MNAPLATLALFLTLTQLPFQSYEKQRMKIRKMSFIAAVTLLAPASAYSFADKAALITAKDLWLSDEASARSTYGGIAGWNVSRVTDMRSEFST